MTTQIQDWIRFWFRRNDREFEEQAQRERELVEESDIPPHILAMCSRFDEDRHKRNQFPVGAFFDWIRQRPDGQKPSAEKLLVVAEAGQELLYEAICTADEDDDEEFFVEAYGYWGPLVDAVLEECDREDRDSATGRRLHSVGGPDDR
jgi:hypothetical protein